MNILSLFDGISCGQVALSRAKIKYKNYFASEIDKYAIEITQKNFPNTEQLGSVENVCADFLPHIDLLIGGSPCQNLSIAGDRKGLKGSKSKLFWEYLRVLNECDPTFFILENVASMKKVDRDIITEELGVEPIMINSALVSAQQRKRLYWTNLPVDNPVDKGVYLQDILEKQPVDKKYSIDTSRYNINIKKCLENKKEQFILTESRTEEAKKIRKEHRERHGKDFSPRRAKELVPRGDDKANCLMTSLNKEHLVFNKPDRVGQIGKGGQRIYSTKGKSVALSALGGGQGGNTGLYAMNGAAIRGRNLNNGSKTTQCLEVNDNKKANCLTTVYKDSVITSLPKGNYPIENFKKSVRKNIIRDYEEIINSEKDIYHCKCESGWQDNKVGLKKSQTLRAGNSFALCKTSDDYIRRLTPLECERLQTLDDGYTEGISDTQRYKAIGNGFTVDVIVHILNSIYDEK